MSFHTGAVIARAVLRAPNRRLQLACVAASIGLHAAILKLLPDLRAPRDAPAQPLIVDLKPKVEPPQHIVEPPRKEPEVRPEPREQPRVQKPAQAEPAPQSAREDKTPPVATVPPVLSIPPDPAATTPAPAPVFTVPAPPPEPPRVQIAPRVRTDAAYLHNPTPAYPAAARRRGDQGTVMVRVLVSAEGLPKNVSLEKTSGFAALDEAALNAVQAWRFVPAREGGQAVEALYTVPVVYRLN